MKRTLYLPYQNDQLNRLFFLLFSLQNLRPKHPHCHQSILQYQLYLKNIIFQSLLFLHDLFINRLTIMEKHTNRRMMSHKSNQIYRNKIIFKLYYRKIHGIFTFFDEGPFRYGFHFIQVVKCIIFSINLVYLTFGNVIYLILLK